MAATKRKPAKRRRQTEPDVPPERWERQPGEGAQAFQAFAAFRDLGPERSINALARTRIKSRSLLGEWSAKHDWQIRVGAWDAHLDKIQQAELKEEKVETAKRHAQLVRGQLAALGQASMELLRRLEDDPGFLRRLPADTLLEVTLAAARATPRLVVSERLSLDMSTANQAGHDGGPLPEDRWSKATEAELDGFLAGAAAGSEAAGKVGSAGPED